jgi:hypothetical protein
LLVSDATEELCFDLRSFLLAQSFRLRQPPLKDRLIRSHLCALPDHHIEEIIETLKPLFDLIDMTETDSRVQNLLQTAKPQSSL